MQINEEIISHVAHLARLKLTDREKKNNAQEITQLLGHFESLDKLDTTGVPITSQVTGLKNVFREDEPIRCPEEIRKNLIDSAPQFHKGYFVVPNSIQK